MSPRTAKIAVGSQKLILKSWSSKVGLQKLVFKNLSSKNQHCISNEYDMVEYCGDRSAGRKSNSQNKYQSPT